MINVEAKVAPTVLYSRMRNVLASIVNCDQTAYEEGRYIIGESIRLVNDILEFTKENNFEGMLCSADFDDSLEHPFILATLESFGFGPQFIQWIKTFSNAAENCHESLIAILVIISFGESMQARLPAFCISIYYLRRGFIHSDSREE